MPAHTRNIANGGESGNLKRSAQHQGLQRQTGKSPAIHHWPYCQTLPASGFNHNETNTLKDISFNKI